MRAGIVLAAVISDCKSSLACKRVKQTRGGWHHNRPGEPVGRTGPEPLTCNFTNGHTILRRLKIVPVAAAATIYKPDTLFLVDVEVPARKHGPAGTSNSLLRADSCEKMGDNEQGGGGRSCHTSILHFNELHVCTSRLSPSCNTSALHIYEEGAKTFQSKTKP